MFLIFDTHIVNPHIFKYRLDLFTFYFLQLASILEKVINVNDNIFIITLLRVKRYRLRPTS